MLLLGASGTIGRATISALLAKGHDAVCFGREGSTKDLPDEVLVRTGDVTDPRSIEKDAICSEHFDAVVSCLASRTGAPSDAWAIDHKAHSQVLAAAKAAGIAHFVLLSAICVQKPLLEFQKAKLAFEAELIASGLTYAIVRPTAFFKSLSGQVARVKAGKPFLVFGDGLLTRCKPISDGDLARFIVECVTDQTRYNRILPIGGPGPAITPREQGEMLFSLLGRVPRFKHVPVGLLDVIIAVLAVGGGVSSRLAEKAELARIGRYYATQSMLVLDPATDAYDEDATPSYGSDLLRDHYRRLIAGDGTAGLGEHAVF